MALINTSSRDTITKAYLKLASDVVNNTQAEEAELRSAISRAYYSIFLSLRDRLFGPDANGLKKETKKLLERRFKQKYRWSPGSHDRVLFALTDLPNTSSIRPITLQQQIGQLKEARVHADYDFTDEKLKEIPYSNWAEYADHTVALASQLLPVVNQLPSYPI